MTVTEPPEELFSAYIDGEVTPAERTAVEGALARSPERRVLLAALAAARDVVRSLPEPQIPAGFLGGLEQAVEGAARPAPARSRRGLAWLAGGVAAAALVAALVIPATDRVDPAVPARLDTHAARASVSDDPVSELAPIAATTGSWRR